MDFLDRMLDHEEWAMAKLFDASAGLSDEQLDQSFDLGLGTVRATFEHIVNETTGFADADEGEEGPTGLSIPALRARYEARYAVFAERQRALRDAGRFDEVVLDHWGYRKTNGGLALEALIHNDEHRTEIVHMLVRLGVEDPVVDIGAREWEVLNG